MLHNIRNISEYMTKFGRIGGSTRQELYDRKISWWFKDEKDLNGDLEWQEKKSELNENGLEWQVSGDMLDDLSWMFCIWEKELLYWILSFILSQ